MNLYGIINHAQTMFPYFTDKFTDNFTIKDITISANLVTCYLNESISAPTINNTKTILKGGSVYIKDAQTIIDIVSIEEYMDDKGKILGFKVTTTTDHDLTCNHSKHTHEYEGFAELHGFPDDAYNKRYTLLDVPDPTTFMIETDMPLPNDIGDVKLYGYISYNFWGRYKVEDVDYETSSFTYIQHNDRSLKEDIIGAGGFVKANGRITGTADPFMFYQSTYTKRPKDELYAVFSVADVSLSKSKLSESDSQAEIMNGNDYRQRMVTDVRLYVMQTIADDFNGIEASTFAFDEMLTVVVRSFLGSKFTSPFGVKDHISPLFMGCKTTIAEKGRYVHEYRLQFSYDVTNSDITPVLNTGAMRRTKHKSKMMGNGVVYGNHDKDAIPTHEWDIVVHHDRSVTEVFPTEVLEQQK